MSWWKVYKTSPRASRTPFLTAGESSVHSVDIVSRARERRRVGGRRDRMAGKVNNAECRTCHSGSCRRELNNGS